ncbi:MAG: hypothetical protein ACO3F7_02190 [Luteolibacter sp.]
MKSEIFFGIFMPVPVFTPPWLLLLVALTASPATPHVLEKKLIPEGLIPAYEGMSLVLVKG